MNGIVDPRLISPSLFPLVNCGESDQKCTFGEEHSLLINWLVDEYGVNILGVDQEVRDTWDDHLGARNIDEPPIHPCLNGFVDVWAWTTLLASIVWWQVAKGTTQWPRQWETQRSSGVNRAWVWFVKIGRGTLPKAQVF